MCMWIGMDMDMDQVWSIFFINLFSALEGVEIAFLGVFFFGLGEKVLNTGVGLVVFFSSYADVGMHSRKERKERKGKGGTCRCREKQDGSGDWMNE